MPDLEDENVDAMNGKETEQIDYKAIEQKLQDDLEEAGDEAIKMREKQRELINALNLDKYAIAEDAEWDEKSMDKATKGKGNVVSIKVGKGNLKENANDIYEKEMKAVKKSKKSKIKGE